MKNKDYVLQLLNELLKGEGQAMSLDGQEDLSNIIGFVENNF